MKKKKASRAALVSVDHGILAGEFLSEQTCCLIQVLELL